MKVAIIVLLLHSVQLNSFYTMKNVLMKINDNYHAQVTNYIWLTIITKVLLVLVNQKSLLTHFSLVRCGAC